MGFKVDDVFVDFIIDFSEGERGAKRINAQMAKMGKVSGVAADAQDRVERSTRRAGAASRAAAKDTKKLGKETKSTAAEVKTMIKRFIGFEVARRVLVAFVRTFVSFRTEMNNVRAITNATDAEFQRLNATAKELGRTTQFTATDSARAMAFLARTGLDVNQTIAVLPGTLNLAAATAVDLATAADLSTNILKGMGLEIAELDSLVDVLARTTNSANVNIFELGEAMKEVGPLAADAGMSIEETAALVGKLGDAGIKSSRAGTALRRMLINLTTGAEGAQAVIDRLGLTIFDAEGNFVGLTNVIGQLEEANLQAGDEFKLFGARGLAAAKVLKRAGAVEIAAFTEELLKAEGTAKRMAEQQLAGLPGSLKLLKSATESTAISWGDALEPAMSGVATVIRVTVLPLLNGILGAIKLIGPAAFLLATSVGLAFNTIGNVVSIAIGGVIQATGKLFRLIGEAGERFGIMEGLSETVANLGLKMERIGGGIVRKNVRDIGADVDQMRFAWEAAREELVETANAMTGVVPAAEDAADAIGNLAEVVDETTAAMQRARTALNLEIFAQQLEAVRALLRETFGFEGEGALGLGQLLEIQRQLVPATEDFRNGVQELLVAERDLAGVIGDVVRIERELVEAGEDLDKIVELNKELEDAVSALAAATRDADAAMEGLTGRGKGIGEMLTQVALAVRGVNRLADAFGLVNDDVRRALDSVLDLVGAFEAIDAAKGALSLGSVLGIAGGAVGLATVVGSLLGGLFGGGDDAASRRREELLERNNERLDELRQEYARSLAVLEQIPGSEFARALDLLGRGTTETITSGGEFPIEFERFLSNLTQEELIFLENLAEALGVTFEITAESFERFGEAIASLRLTELTESFTGALSLLQRRFAIFDVDDPADRLRAMLDLLTEFGQLDITLPGIGTEAGRAALEALIKTLFEEIEAGTFDLARLGGLTLADFLDLLGGMEELLDNIDQDGVTTDEGLTENFVRSTRITEVQGNELLTLARTELIVERLNLAANLESARLLGIMAAIGAPPPGVNADVARATGTINVGGVTVHAAITVTEEIDADVLVDRLGTRLAGVVDAQLNELQTREDRAVGETGRVA